MLGKRLGSRHTEAVALTPDWMLLAVDQHDSAVLFAADPATGAVKQLFTTPDRIGTGRCNAARQCVVQISKPAAARNVFGGDDVGSLIFVDGDTVTSLVVPKVAKHVTETAQPVSPDGTIVIVNTSDGKDSRLVAWTRGTQRVHEHHHSGEFNEIVGWRKDQGQWTAPGMRHALVVKADGAYLASIEAP